MMGMAIWAAAAAQAPVLLASADEQQWRRFVRASVQRSAGPALGGGEGIRLRQLRSIVRDLPDDRRDRLAGPSAL